jgi:hypothetical protein
MAKAAMPWMAGFRILSGAILGMHMASKKRLKSVKAALLGCLHAFCRKIEL